MSGRMKIRENAEFRFPMYILSTRGTVEVYLDLKAPISLSCQNCESRHLHLNPNDKW